MPDLTFNQFPISGKIVDFDQLQTDVNNLNANAVLESRTINGYDLSANRTIYAQDVPSKNLLPNTAGSVSGNGLTITANADGSVTVSGTATANVTYYFVGSDSSRHDFQSGTFIVSDGVESGDSANRHMFVNYYEGSTYKGQANTYSTPQFTLGSGYSIRCGLYITNGTALNTPVTFYPMIRLASITDDTYVPYAKTNVELTGTVGSLLKVLKLSDTIGALSAGDSGFRTLTGTIENGYKAIKINTIEYGHPGTSKFVVCTSSLSGTTGNISCYCPYYAYGATQANSTDFSVYILCVKDEISTS